MVLEFVFVLVFSDWPSVLKLVWSFLREASGLLGAALLRLEDLASLVGLIGACITAIENGVCFLYSTCNNLGKHLM